MLPEADSSLDSLEFCSDDWVWFVDVELDELDVELADVLLLDDAELFKFACGLWLTPITRTVGLPKAVAFISMDGAAAAPKTNGMVACVVPLTESTVIFGNPFYTKPSTFDNKLRAQHLDLLWRGKKKYCKLHLLKSSWNGSLKQLNHILHILLWNIGITNGWYANFEYGRFHCLLCQNVHIRVI